MLSAKIQNNIIKIKCFKNQVIDTDKLNFLYNSALRFIHQNDKLPIIIELESNVTVSLEVIKIINRIEHQFNNKTIVIIAG